MTTFLHRLHMNTYEVADGLQVGQQGLATCPTQVNREIAAFQTPVNNMLSHSQVSMPILLQASQHEGLSCCEESSFSGQGSAVALSPVGVHLSP